MRPRVNAQRRLWKFLVYGLITFGIYQIYFMWTLVNDINIACEYKEPGRKSPHYLVVVLLSIVTLGIYSFIWYYQQGNRLKSAGERYGIRIEESGAVYLMWMIFGLLLFGVGPVVALYFLIHNANLVCEAYNTEVSRLQYAQEPYEEYYGGSVDMSDRYSETIAQPGPGAYASNSEKRSGSLHFVSGEYHGERIPIADGESITMGRNPALCQLVFQNLNISRKHCTVTYVAGAGYDITDFSTSGTVVNGSLRLQNGMKTRCEKGARVALSDGTNAFVLE